MGWKHLILFVHLTGIVFWVGGMVFIRVCLAPSKMPLGVWLEILTRFFMLSQVAIALIAISGTLRLFDPRIGQPPLAWQLMGVTGTAAIVMFLGAVRGAWRQLYEAARSGEKNAIQEAMSRFRRWLDIVLVFVTLTGTAATFGLGI
jgi:uncharacterized membrane protein